MDIAARWHITVHCMEHWYYVLVVCECRLDWSGLVAAKALILIRWIMPFGHPAWASLCGKSFCTVNQLKQSIVLELCAQSQPFISHSIGKWELCFQYARWIHCEHISFADIAVKIIVTTDIPVIFSGILIHHSFCCKLSACLRRVNKHIAQICYAFINMTVIVPYVAFMMHSIVTFKLASLAK